MIGAEPVAWSQAAAPILAALAVLFLPGFGALWLLRLPWAVSLLAAPLVSVSVLTLGGVACAGVDVSWGPPAMAVATALTWAVAAAFGRMLRAERGTLDLHWTWVVFPLGAAAVAGAVPYVVVSGSADAFPQHPDTIFHLGTALSMLQSGDISTLHAIQYLTPGVAGFYPAAFHGLVATVCQLTGVSVAVGSSVLALVTAVVVWPAGAMLLATSVLGARPVVAAGSAVLSVSFATFPFWLMGYGVLWPNLLGEALLPAAVAFVIWAVRGERRAVALLVSAGTVPGLVAAHPNAVFAYVLLVVAVVVVALSGKALALGRRRDPAKAVLLAGAALVLAAATVRLWTLGASLAPSLVGSNPAGAEMPGRDSVVDLAFDAARDAQPQWLLGGLVLAGAVAALTRYRRGVWVVVAYVAIASLYFLNTAVDTPTTRLLTWPWYNNSPRLAGLLVLPSVVLAATAITAAVDLVASSGDIRRPRRLLAGGVATALLMAVTLDGRGGRQAILEPYFPPTAGSSWVTSKELGALQRLSGSIPPDAVVAANPYKGGNFVYLVSGRRTLYPSEKAMRAGDLALLGKRLDDAGASDAVCAAAKREGVTYAIAGGKPVAAGRTASRVRAYRGVDSVPLSDAFTLVAAEGPYRLYRLDGCGDDR